MSSSGGGGPLWPVASLTQQCPMKTGSLDPLWILVVDSGHSTPAQGLVEGNLPLLWFPDWAEPEVMTRTSTGNNWGKLLGGLCIGETGAYPVMGHILSVMLSQKLPCVGTLLLNKIKCSIKCLVWYYQKIGIPLVRFVKIRKVCFCHGNPNILKQTKCRFVTV